MKNITFHNPFSTHYILGMTAAALLLTACEKKADEQQAPAGVTQTTEPKTEARTITPPVVTPATSPSAGQRPLTLEGFMTAPDLSSPERIIQGDEEGTLPVQLGTDLPYTLD